MDGFDESVKSSPHAGLFVSGYKDVVPPDRKKNGFMSSDYPRRDEFSNTIRTEQLREVLKVRKNQQQALFPCHDPKLLLQKETAKMHEMKVAAEKRGTGAHTTA